MATTLDLARRSETGADATFRLALFRESLQPPESFPGFDPALADALLRHQLAGQETSYRAAYPDARLEIVEADGEPIGRIVTARSAEALTLVDIALLSGWRGRGLGTRLIAEVIAEAGAAGLPVRLRVLATNHAARRLYRRLGFEEAGMTEVDVAMERRPARRDDSGNGETTDISMTACRSGVDP